VGERAELQRLRLVVPGESTLTLVVAALVGVYAGLATGLFANAIAVFHLIFFRTGTLLASLGPGQAGHVWRVRFVEQLVRARWHLEYLIVGGAGILGCGILDRYARLGQVDRRTPVPGGKRPFLTIARMLAAGLLLFYPLTLMAVFNRSFLADMKSIVEEAPWFVVLLVPALGGLAVGIIVHHVSPESKGHGVGEVIESVAVHGGRIPTSVGIFKSLTAAITIGSGGSVGREGPVVQVGSAVGSAMGRHLEFTRGNVIVLVGAGAAAGIASSFNAPIAGAMFALEIILLDFRVTAFTPIVLASVTSVLTAQSLIGEVQEIVRPAYELVSPLEILPYALLGVAAGGVGHLYIRAMEGVEAVFDGSAGHAVARFLGRLPAQVKPGLGGLMLGVIGLVVPRALGTGYETMNAALIGQLGLATLLMVLFGKIAATSLTLGSGGSGGSFFPAMFLGAMLGGAFGSVVHLVFPDATASAGAYALVGMGAVVAGATLAPLTGIVMMFELTGNYQIILPLMVTCVIASTMVHRTMGDSMYTLKLRRRGVLLRAHREQVVLRSLHVSQAMTTGVVSVQENTRFRDLMSVLTSTTYATFPVLDAAGHLTGLLSVDDVRSVLYEEGLSDLVVAKELSRPPAATVFEDDDLETALQKFGQGDVHLLPVVAKDDARRLVGVLSRRDVLRAYGRAARAA
jgi:CIC family chloride channel protein